MLSSSTCAPFELALALALAGCGSSGGQSDAGDWTLTLDTATTAIARVRATVDVGAEPAPGVVTSETAAAWDLVALSSTTSCTFQAGSDGVPSGSFTLTLTSVDAASGTAHGTFDAVTYVHAPPTTDCGYDDVENVSIQF